MPVAPFLTAPTIAAISASATVSGLVTPPAGNFKAYMGALVWEGDDGINGDQFNLSGAGVQNGGNLSDAQSPVNNFWNSRISRLGSLFTNRNPAYANNFAIDLKMVDISNVPANTGPRMANSGTTAATRGRAKREARLRVGPGGCAGGFMRPPAGSPRRARFGSGCCPACGAGG